MPLWFLRGLNDPFAAETLLLLSMLLVGVFAGHCPSANINSVTKLGPQIDIKHSTGVGAYNSYFAQQPKTGVSFNVNEDDIQETIDIRTNNNRGRSYFFGVVYDGPKTLWYRDPNNSRCTIDFDNHTIPNKYVVQEVRF